MAINYRVGTIIIAAITIIGGIFDSVQLFFPPPPQGTEGFNATNKQFLYVDNVALYRGLSVAANIVSMVASMGLYFVISIDIKLNVQRRKFLLPFSIWSLFICVWRLIAFAILLLKYGEEIDRVTYAMWLGGAFVMLMFSGVELSYYRLLSHDNGSKLDSKSLMLKERPLQLRKYRLGVMGRIYYSDENEKGGSEEGSDGGKKKKKKKNDHEFLRNQLKQMNANLFI